MTDLTETVPTCQVLTNVHINSDQYRVCLHWNSDYFKSTQICQYAERTKSDSDLLLHNSRHMLSCVYHHFLPNLDILT